jgi:hypothetical protein
MQEETGRRSNRERTAGRGTVWVRSGRIGGVLLSRV